MSAKPFDPNAPCFKVECRLPQTDPDRQHIENWVVLFDSLLKEDAEEKAAFMRRGQPAPGSVRVVPVQYQG